jgi:hypothetical protein
MANVNLTYRDVINAFDAAATAHLQIASFDHGTIDYLDSSAVDRLYPYIFLRPLDSTVAERVKTYNFELYSLDIPKVSGAPNLDVISNTENYLYDLVAWFNFGPAERQQYYDVQINSAAPVNEAFKDRVFGWVASINVITPFNLNYCNYPD